MFREKSIKKYRNQLSLSAFSMNSYNHTLSDFSSMYSTTASDKYNQNILSQIKINITKT